MGGRGRVESSRSGSQSFPKIALNVISRKVKYRIVFTTQMFVFVVPF